MRIGVFSDIHGNLEALEIVLEQLLQHRCDRLVCLGDVVGYGANPNECAELVRQHADVVLMGNHDCATAALMDVSYFNPYAQEALRWTRDRLSGGNLAFLRELPLMHELGLATFVHATPFQPEMWHYVVTVTDAHFQLDYFERQVCFIGHSHQPMAIGFAPGHDDFEIYDDLLIDLVPRWRYIVNVGSVGQPRDGIPDASYAIFDEEDGRIEVRRVPYPIAAVQRKMREAGIHPFLIERLQHGR